MEQDFITYFGSFGAIGIICFTLFKKFLQDAENDKQYYRNQIESNQKIYQAELKADRELYINSMNSVVNKLEGLEQDISEIKEIIKK